MILDTASDGTAEITVNDRKDHESTVGKLKKRQYDDSLLSRHCSALISLNYAHCFAVPPETLASPAQQLDETVDSTVPTFHRHRCAGRRRA